MPVATVLTVYGIETKSSIINLLVIARVATVLTVYGIETLNNYVYLDIHQIVATVLTVYGMRRRVRGSRGVKRR